MTNVVKDVKDAQVENTLEFRSGELCAYLTVLSLIDRRAITCGDSQASVALAVLACDVAKLANGGAV